MASVVVVVVVVVVALIDGVDFTVAGDVTAEKRCEGQAGRSVALSRWCCRVDRVDAVVGRTE